MTISYDDYNRVCECCGEPTQSADFLCMECEDAQRRQEEEDLAPLPDNTCEICETAFEPEQMHDKYTCEDCFASCGGYDEFDHHIGDQQLDSDPYHYDPPGW